MAADRVGLSVDPTHYSDTWSGDCDGEPWLLEIEPDRFDAGASGVTVWIQNPKTRSAEETGLAFLTPDEARAAAAVLLACANEVEKRNGGRDA